MAEQAHRDLAARPLSFLWAWGLPTAILVGTSMAQDGVPPIAHVSAISGAFLWMGVACLINAQRCRRLHCFISGPVFLVGALAVVLIGTGVIAAGPATAEHIVWITLGLVMLSFVPEVVRGRYLR